MPEKPGPADDLERLTGMTRRELEVYEDETLQRWREGGLDEETIWRIRRVHRLRRQLGLDYESIEIIVRLVDRIERLESGRRTPDIIVRVLDE